MGRTLIAVVLLVAVTQAQVGGLAVAQPQPVAQDRVSLPQPSIEALPRYLALRRGTEEKVLLVAVLNPTAQSWTGTYWGAPSPENGAMVATELKIEPPEGFAIRGIEYPKSHRVSLRPGEEPVRVLGPGAIELRFKLRADRNVDLGDHVLKGKLKFQLINRVGDSSTHELEFSVPIRVVDHDAAVAKNSSYPQGVTPIETVQIAALVPLILLAIPFAIVALFTGWDGC